MKKVLKIWLIFLIVMMTVVEFTTVVKAEEGEENEKIVEEGAPSTLEQYIDGFGGSLEEADIKGSRDSITTIAGRLLSYLQVGTALLTVVIIASVGIRYIVETPEVKGDIKKTMLPIVTGIIFVFFATSIAKFFMGLFS